MNQTKIRQALAHGVAALADISDSPKLEAERLLVHALKTPESSWLYAHFEEVLDEAQAQIFFGLIKKRLTGYPIAYILGRQDFYGRCFKVTPDVLIPRPETESLVDLALEKIKELSLKRARKLVIADIGCGSGCIAITLALEAPLAIERVIAADISAAALSIAADNMEFHQTSRNIELRQGNLLEPLELGKVDFIVSNPPYIPATELDRILTSPDKNNISLAFEPRLALDGGQDGNQYINQIKTAGIPAVVEIQNGKVIAINC